MSGCSGGVYLRKGKYRSFKAVSYENRDISKRWSWYFVDILSVSDMAGTKQGTLVIRKEKEGTMRAHDGENGNKDIQKATEQCFSTSGMQRSSRWDTQSRK